MINNKITTTGQIIFKLKKTDKEKIVKEAGVGGGGAGENTLLMKEQG